MEIEYKVKLYYRIDRLEEVLLKLPTLADPIEGALCTIALANDRCVHLPFTSGEQNRLINFQYSRGANFDTRLIFDIDDPLLDYMRSAESTAKLDRQTNRVSIGFIYVYVRLGSEYLELVFSGDSSRINKLFLDSRSIQNRFIEFMHDTGGLFGLLDLEINYYLLTPTLDRKIARPSAAIQIEAIPNWDIPYYEEEIVYHIDLYVAECLSQL
ncbi:hypothetical protein [Chamaesiphon sp. VAR_48_metabat_403]|uniref:hypothetical protein n=1 Tax=Chamaesiphon sp. VAR_48_metabat_403 TaxID=2964700 RepID=UPI00286DAFDB|nr:hypothetical protein [Chamaesiphon sp. VAR_48_metabat_403]